MVTTERTRRVRLLCICKIIEKSQPHKSPVSVSRPESFFGEESRSDGAHDTRIWRPHHFSADILLHGPKDRIVQESTTLHDDFFTEALYIFDTDDLGKYIFYDGTAESGHDVRRLFPVSLLRDDAAVHKHGAAAAEHGRILRGERRFRDLLYRDMQ